jgi:hypothetical protein
MQGKGKCEKFLLDLVVIVVVELCHGESFDIRPHPVVAFQPRTKILRQK